MRTLKIFLAIMFITVSLHSQTKIPGDSIVYGPMFSPVYENKVRVWMVTKVNTKEKKSLMLSMKSKENPSVELSGTIYNSDDRHLVYKAFETGELQSDKITRVEDYALRSYEFSVKEGETYVAKLLEDGKEIGRNAEIKADAATYLKTKRKGLNNGK